jgi:spermidine synthase
MSAGGARGRPASHAYDLRVSRSEVVERVVSPRGEIVLRRAGPHYEIISNGVFLMDTSDGRSERLLVDAALEFTPAPAVAVAVGGLGVGFTLAQALRHPRVATVTVVEVEPAVIAWHTEYLAAVSGVSLDHPRVTVVCADFRRWLDETSDRFDVLCLDVDNGPEWTVTPSNERLYSDTGIVSLREKLRSGGVLAVWSANRSDEFERRLRQHFPRVELRTVPVPRGEPDCVYLAKR